MIFLIISLVFGTLYTVTFSLAYGVLTMVFFILALITGSKTY